MSYGILKFKIPEEQNQFKQAQDAWKYQATLEDLDNWMHSKLKHTELPDGERIALTETRKKLFELLNKRDVSLFG